MKDRLGMISLQAHARKPAGYPSLGQKGNTANPYKNKRRTSNSLGSLRCSICLKREKERKEYLFEIQIDT
ncbi:unnamed protein product [Onchocerca flexuosa]|uniref:Ovule protein n=1 Tax=Onchocerca flexuosa TaxID=387005 RepID=A0A183I2W6_9BILA|nr:unnamed protein product [Onchocerca flexuosa]